MVSIEAALVWEFYDYDTLVVEQLCCESSVSTNIVYRSPFVTYSSHKT